MRLLVLLLILLCLAPAALAASGPCRTDGGPRCRFWTAKVVTIDDGDTIHVRLAGRIRTVRFIGIQAMEQSVYTHVVSQRRGECHALEATARLERMIHPGSTVRLAAQDPASHAGYRLRRSVAYRSGGRWHDIGQVMMREGYTLFLVGTIETAWNRLYNRLGQEAAQRHVNMFDTTHCGSGPDQDVPLRVWVSSDPLSADTQHVNGEFMKVQNRSATKTLSLAHWWIRDSLLRRFEFPAGTKVGPGDTATVFVGRGQRSANSFYWGFSRPIFENPDARDLGNGAYLFDPKGDLRAWMIYPCLAACTDPLQGTIEVSAHPTRPEYARFHNVSDRPVDLYGYAMAIPGSTYPFPVDSVVQPGETLQVDVAGDPSADTRLRKSWGLDGRWLPDPGGSVSLTTFSYITLGCDRWGSGRC
jgi:endonuclease YncB( thermonuclease family)